MSRSKNFVFTWNNYDDSSEKTLSELKYKYIFYGKEIAPTTGTPHLQGYIVFPNQMTETSIRKKLVGAHIEVMKGTLEQNNSYCSKSGNVIELGTKPLVPKEKGELEQEKWKNIREAAETGNFDSIPEKIRFNQNKLIDYIHEKAQKKRKLDPIDELQNQWYYGASGTGKSLKARTEHPDAYIKMNNKWWDGYDGQETVIIEDFNLEQSKYLAHHLKIWSDHYGFPAERKGGTIFIRPKRIIVTSNYSIDEAFQEDKTGALEPLSRRFKQTHFTPFFK